MSNPEEPEPTGEPPVEAPLSPEETAQRTAGGVARWLAGSVIAFWLAVIGVVVAVIQDSLIARNVSLLLLFVTLVTTVILYFSVMLEPAIFADRKVKLGLALSFADLCVLTLIFIFVESGGMHFSLTVALALAMMTAAIAVLTYAFRSNKRFMFLLALAILLASNMVKVG